MAISSHSIRGIVERNERSIDRSLAAIFPPPPPPPLSTFAVFVLIKVVEEFHYDTKHVRDVGRAAACSAALPIPAIDFSIAKITSSPNPSLFLPLCHLFFLLSTLYSVCLESA